MIRVGSILQFNELQGNFSNSYVGTIFIVENILSENKFVIRYLYVRDKSAHNKETRSNWGTPPCYDIIEE